MKTSFANCKIPTISSRRRWTTRWAVERRTRSPTLFSISSCCSGTFDIRGATLPRVSRPSSSAFDWKPTSSNCNSSFVFNGTFPPSVLEQLFVIVFIDEQLNLRVCLCGLYLLEYENHVARLSKVCIWGFSINSIYRTWILPSWFNGSSPLVIDLMQNSIFSIYCSVNMERARYEMFHRILHETHHKSYLEA